jgi:hypothetical protein
MHAKHIVSRMGCLLTKPESVLQARQGPVRAKRTALMKEFMRLADTVIERSKTCSRLPTKTPDACPERGNSGTQAVCRRR